MLLILSGLSLQSTPDEQATFLWEEIPDEEVHAVVKKEEQKADMGFYEPVEEIQYDEVGQPSEGLSQAAGEINEFTLDDAQLLMRIAQAEAGNQGVDGMWLVMSVVLNRVDSSDYPDNITEVVYQPHQFSSVTDGNLDNQMIIRQESHEALVKIESGEVAPEILAFETKDSRELDKYFLEAFVYRDHRFYTQK